MRPFIANRINENQDQTAKAGETTGAQDQRKSEEQTQPRILKEPAVAPAAATASPAVKLVDAPGKRDADVQENGNADASQTQCVFTIPLCVIIKADRACVQKCERKGQAEAKGDIF